MVQRISTWMVCGLLAATVVVPAAIAQGNGPADPPAARALARVSPRPRTRGVDQDRVRRRGRGLEKAPKRASAAWKACSPSYRSSS